MFYRKYLGGLAMICYYLLSETPAHVDPLGPENKLIFATGPLTGITTGGSGRKASVPVHPSRAPWALRKWAVFGGRN